MSRKSSKYVVIVRFETEDGRTLEVTSKPMGLRAAQRLAHRHNVGHYRFGPGTYGYTSWDLVNREELPAHVNMYFKNTGAYSVREVSDGHDLP